MNECLNEVRAHAPLVHCITNYVTVNDVANVILACGGSPIMSDEPQDVVSVLPLHQSKETAEVYFALSEEWKNTSFHIYAFAVNARATCLP